MALEETFLPSVGKISTSAFAQIKREENRERNARECHTTNFGFLCPITFILVQPNLDTEISQEMTFGRHLAAQVGRRRRKTQNQARKTAKIERTSE
jgi:hypothetical protein